MTFQSLSFTQEKFLFWVNTEKSELYFSWAIIYQYVEHLFLTLHLCPSRMEPFDRSFSFFFGFTLILYHLIFYAFLDAAFNFL